MRAGAGPRQGPPPLRPLGLRLDRDGRFTHEGVAITHARLRAAFDRSVRYLPDEGAYVVQLGRFRGLLEVEEAAFFVRSFDARTGTLSLSDGSKEALEVASLRVSPIDGALLCSVKRDLAPGRAAGALPARRAGGAAGRGGGGSGADPRCASRTARSSGARALIAGARDGPPESFRAGAGAAIVDREGRVLAFDRADVDGPAWQLPQGGLERGESPERAVWREVEEETGLTAARLELLGSLPEPLAYELPEAMRSARTGRGQVIYWFFFALVGAGARAAAAARRVPRVPADGLRRAGGGGGRLPEAGLPAAPAALRGGDPEAPRGAGGMTGSGCAAASIPMPGGMSAGSTSRSA